MSKEKRIRDIQIKFRVTAEEHDAILRKMALMGTDNLGLYMRKMAIDGYVIRLDLSEIREMITLLRRYASNLNQLTRRVHETGRFYEHDLEDVQDNQDKLWEAANRILSALTPLR